MKIANVSGRLALIRDEGGVDVAAASGGRFGPDPQAVYGQWKAFREWADGAPSRGAAPIDVKDLGAPAPRPAQVFAIGANYRDHAAEAGLEVPASPATFTKFPTCLTAPFADVVLPSETVDWEVELVAVIGHNTHHVSMRTPGITWPDSPLANRSVSSVGYKHISTPSTMRLSARAAAIIAGAWSASVWPLAGVAASR